MLFFGIKNLWFRLGIIIIVAAWALAFAFWMYRNFYVVSPYDPTLTGTAVYGRNGADAFNSVGIILLIESAVLLATLLPFSFSRFYWIRLLILQMVFGGWLFLLFLGAMHSGSVYMIHLLAVLVVNVIIFLLLIISIIAEVKNPAKQT